MLSVTVLNAQEEKSKKIRKIKFSELSIYAGDIENFIPDNDADKAIQNFKTLAPQSVLLNSDLSKYEYKGDNGLTGQLQGHGMYSILAGFQLGDKQKNSYSTHTLLRLQVSYYRCATPLFSMFTKYDDRTIYDTIHPNSGPVLQYLQTIHRFSMEYTAKQLRLGVGFIYRVNPEKRWSFHTGIEIAGHITFDAVTKIHYRKENILIANSFVLGPFDPSYTGIYSGLNTIEIDEKYDSKNNYGFSAYVPLIVNFKFGKKREFWKHIHLFFELDGGVNMISIPGVRTIKYANLLNGLGLKYSWN